MKKITLFGSAVLLAAACFCIFSFQGNTQTVLLQDIPKDVGLIIVDDVWLQGHKDRTAKIVEPLKGQTLDETFAGLLDDQQFLSPGYHSQIMGAPHQMESMLSARGFLKVLQQFDALPRDEAIAKLDGFCKRAVSEYEFAISGDQTRYGQPEPTPTLSESRSIIGAKYMICMTMLLAAKVDEYHLIHRQINEMYRASGTYMGRAADSDIFPNSFGRVAPIFAVLEDDCLFTVLMYAAKRAKIDVSDISSEDFKRKTIPLYRWDSEICYYDFLVQDGHMQPAPKDLVEQFDVYEFGNSVAVDRRAIVTKLAERLKK